MLVVYSSSPNLDPRPIQPYHIHMKHFLLWIWQLPQHLIAVFILYVLNRKSDRKECEIAGIRVWKVKGWTVCNCGVSLGDYILLPSSRVNNETVAKHEHGHQYQSRYFGWLYLILVGIASAVFNNLWDRLFHKSWTAEERNRWYYSRYPEKWADELGGVER